MCRKLLLLIVVMKPKYIFEVLVPVFVCWCVETVLGSGTTEKHKFYGDVCTTKVSFELCHNLGKALLIPFV